MCTVTGPVRLRATPSYVKHLPELSFPFVTLPDIYAPPSTVFKLADGRRVNTFLWCYLTREVGVQYAVFEPQSLSPARVHALPRALERLSAWFRFKGARPATVFTMVRALTLLLNWADAAEHGRRYEYMLSDASVALAALQGYHRHLRDGIQAHRKGVNTAAYNDQNALAMLSEIHGHEFRNDVECLVHSRSGGTAPLSDEALSSFMTSVQLVFDAVVRQVLPHAPSLTDAVGAVAPRATPHTRLSLAEGDIGATLPSYFTEAHLMELGCVAFAALTLGDSGANLAQLQSFEEPDDLPGLLSSPERVNLTVRQIKFRAAGQAVAVQLTATTLSRLRAYLDLRERLRRQLGADELTPLFVQGEFSHARGRSARTVLAALRPLDRAFLSDVRRKFKAFGTPLPEVTFRQLRAFKQQHLVRRHGPTLAAELMGHSLATGVKAYSRAQSHVHRREMDAFLASLSARILLPADAKAGMAGIVSIPAGSCTALDQPQASEPNPTVSPDCGRPEGCFFCAQFHVHTDLRDTAKLLSCRQVLQRVAPLQERSSEAERIYGAVIERIDALLNEIQRVAPTTHAQAVRDVTERGELSAYWALKLQQLGLLGLLAPQVAHSA